MGVVFNLSARNMPCELIGNGAPGPDGSPPFTGCNLWRPSDLELYLLWTASEYVLATKDGAFMAQTVQRRAVHGRPGGAEVTVGQALVGSFWFFCNHTGVGEQGLIKASSGAWNDMHARTHARTRVHARAHSFRKQGPACTFSLPFPWPGTRNLHCIRCVVVVVMWGKGERHMTHVLCTHGAHT